MVALAADRNTPARSGESFHDPVKAGVVIFAGALACLDAAGRLVPASTAVGLVARGRAQGKFVGGAADGDVQGESRPGVYRFANSAAADAISRAEIGDDCYIVDDQTVAKTDGGATRSKAGRIADVDANGVWVRIGL